MEAKLAIVLRNSFSSFEGHLPEKTYLLVKAVLTYKDEAIENQIQTEFALIRTIKRFGKNPGKGENRAQATKRMNRSVAIKSRNIRELEKKKIVCLLEGKVFRTGLLKIVEKALSIHGVSYTINDLRERPEPYLILPWRNKPFTPRYYQDEQIEACVNSGRGVIESAVGTGKSLVQAYITKELRVKGIYIVPSSGLSVQLSEEFKIWFGRHRVGLFTAAKIRKAKTLPDLRFITIKAVAALQKSGDLDLLVEGVDALFIDEIHHAGAASYIDSLKSFNDIFFRFGFTGTFVRNDSKILEMWSFLSTVLHRYSAKKAIKDGFLTPIIHVTHNLGGTDDRKYMKEYSDNYGTGGELREEILNTIQGIDEVFQILILVKFKALGGALIHKYLRDKNIKSTFISGDTDKFDIYEAIEKFNEGKIRILIGSSVIGEGIDVKSADHLFNCVGEKSIITVVQGTGRLARLCEGKIVGFYHDFNFEDTKYLKKHFDIRKGIISDNFAPKEFITW